MMKKTQKNTDRKFHKICLISLFALGLVGCGDDETKQLEDFAQKVEAANKERIEEARKHNAQNQEFLKRMGRSLAYGPKKTEEEWDEEDHRQARKKERNTLENRKKKAEFWKNQGIWVETGLQRMRDNGELIVNGVKGQLYMDYDATEEGKKLLAFDRWLAGHDD